MGNFYNAIGSIAKSAIVVVFCCLILAQNLHASESLNVSELREATNYPIPCHQIEAFHYV